MKASLFALTLWLSLAPTRPPGDHLIPDCGVLAEPDRYLLTVHHVFEAAFQDDVPLRAIAVPSFEREYAIGVRESKEGAELFLLLPSSQIWDTEILQEFEEGKIKSTVKGRIVTLEQDPAYQRVKKTAPSDYRKIRVEREARPLPKDVADRLKALWDEMLLNVRHPAELEHGQDGETYYFSAWLRGRGQLSGHAWSPEPASKTGRLVALVGALKDYSCRKLELNQLTERLDQAEKP
jgi:hypothetical protein